MVAGLLYIAIQECYDGNFTSAITIRAELGTKNKQNKTPLDLPAMHGFYGRLILTKTKFCTAPFGTHTEK